MLGWTRKKEGYKNHSMPIVNTFKMKAVGWSKQNIEERWSMSKIDQKIKKENNEVLELKIEKNGPRKIRYS